MLGLQSPASHEVIELGLQGGGHLVRLRTAAFLVGVPAGLAVRERGVLSSRRFPLFLLVFDLLQLSFLTPVNERTRRTVVMTLWLRGCSYLALMATIDNGPEKTTGPLGSGFTTLSARSVCVSPKKDQSYPSWQRAITVIFCFDRSL